jgi:hypothetical protein
MALLWTRDRGGCLSLSSVGLVGGFLAAGTAVILVLSLFSAFVPASLLREIRQFHVFFIPARLVRSWFFEPRYAFFGCFLFYGCFSRVYSIRIENLRGRDVAPLVPYCCYCAAFLALLVV